MNMKFVGIIVIIVIALVSVGILTSKDEGANTSNAQPSNNSVGSTELGVNFVEAGDFECPACASFHPLLKQVKEEYADRVQFTFKHFPLTAIHPNALAGHRAAEAAAKQGKFWEMHDLLFEQRERWISSSTSSPVPAFEEFAAQIGLDLDQFRADFANPATNATINLDIEQMRVHGFSSTPSFLLNDQPLESRDIDTVGKLRAVLDEAINNASGKDTADQSQPATETTPETQSSDTAN